ncbi:YbaB/EbfC family nucleoid-associated protein [Actinopolymorpha sp. B17G11]|uniref:YbaB/EbfC family nucleoid-associated protein n=1 Tax=unclassified Actinopolymorpha TaxID=2627063 RepID=UPI0032D98A78
MTRPAWLVSHTIGGTAMADVSASDFDRLFSESLAALRPIVEQDDESDERTEQVRGVGEALDGHVRVTAKPGGRLESVELNPRALRSDSASLAEAFLTAANAALEDLQQRLSAALPDVPDQQQLMERLQEFQNQSVAQMQRYLTAIADVQDRLDRDDRG